MHAINDKKLQNSLNLFTSKRRKILEKDLKSIIYNKLKTAFISFNSLQITFYGSKCNISLEKTPTQFTTPTKNGTSKNGMQ